MKNEHELYAVIGMGGTIIMKPGKDGLVPAASVEELLNLVPTIKEIADIEFHEVERRDSTNINPAHWQKLVYKIQELLKRKEIKGILVTHGTDTLAYTATAVSLALGPGIKIPIGFTGSQLSVFAIGNDARRNIENSMMTLVKASAENVAETMIIFGDRILRASRTLKSSERKFDAFDSPAYSDLGWIDVDGVHFISSVKKADENARLDIQPHFQRGILAVDVLPGLEPGLLMRVMESGGCHALLLKSLGAGNVPTLDEYSLIPVIEAGTHKFKIPVFISTNFPGGNTDMTLYEVGNLAFKAGAIPTGNMTHVAAQVKIMWLLAQGYTERDELMSMVLKDFVGEVTERKL